MKRGKMKFRKAKQDDKEEILALYQSLIGLHTAHGATGIRENRNLIMI